MSLLQQRQKTATAIAEGKFIANILGEASKELDAKIKERLSSFSESFWSKRNFAIKDTTLVYTTLLQHRFVDMKTRQTAGGKIKKRSYKNHNKPIYGQLNEIARELSVGFTDAVKAKFMQLEK